MVKLTPYNKGGDSMITHMMFIAGEHNGRFKCAAEFAFNPPICVLAAPKVECLFLNKSLEKCKKIAESHGFKVMVTGVYSRSKTPPEKPADVLEFKKAP
jgi:hypothetical protein